MPEPDNPDEHPQKSAEPDDFLARWAALEAQQRARGCQLLRDACDQLADLGVARVTIPYNGFGDSGTVEAPEAAGRDTTAIALPAPLAQALRDAVEWILPGGWEDNAGACGELILDVAERTVLRAHYWRVESSEYDEVSIKL